MASCVIRQDNSQTDQNVLNKNTLGENYVKLEPEK